MSHRSEQHPARSLDPNHTHTPKNTPKQAKSPGISVPACTCVGQEATRRFFKHVYKWPTNRTILHTRSSPCPDSDTVTRATHVLHYRPCTGLLHPFSRVHATCTHAYNKPAGWKNLFPFVKTSFSTGRWTFLNYMAQLTARTRLLQLHKFIFTPGVGLYTPSDIDVHSFSFFFPFFIYIFVLY